MLVKLLDHTLGKGCLGVVHVVLEDSSSGEASAMMFIGAWSLGWEKKVALARTSLIVAKVAVEL